jgi:hypothetical protein
MKSLKNLADRPAAAALVADDILEFHAGRLLLLLSTCGGTGGSINGLTKMAKLDFFVRYPDIAREAALGDRLHLVLGPFVQLALEKDIEPIQVIATSRGLPERPNINFIYLKEVWR